MDWDEAGMLVDRVRESERLIESGGGRSLADAARDVAMLRRFAAWNALLITRALDGMPQLVFGWAQWEAMGRYPVRPETRIALLSPLRRPVSTGEDGRDCRIPLAGPESSKDEARWLRAAWVTVSAFDAPDTDGRPLESMFREDPLPDRDKQVDTLSVMLEAMGPIVRETTGGRAIRLETTGARPVASYDPVLVDPTVLAHLVAHLATDRGVDELSRAVALTVMLCAMLGLEPPDAVPMPKELGVVDVLESSRMSLARLDSHAPGSGRTSSGRGSSVMRLPAQAPGRDAPPSPPGGDDPEKPERAGAGPSDGTVPDVLVFDTACPVCGRLS